MTDNYYLNSYREINPVHMGLSKCYFYEHRTNAAKFEIEKKKKTIMQKNLPGKDLIKKIYSSPTGFLHGLFMCANTTPQTVENIKHISRYLRCWWCRPVAEVEIQSMKRWRVCLQSEIRPSDASLPPRFLQVLSRGPASLRAVLFIACHISGTSEKQTLEQCLKLII